MTDALTAQERAACAVLADTLAAARVWPRLESIALLFGLAALAVKSLAGSPSIVGLAIGAAALALTVLARVLALRVALDARLFDRLAQGAIGSWAELDFALQQALSVPAAKAGRPMQARMQGTRRLLLALVGACLLQAVLAVLAWWPR